MRASLLLVAALAVGEGAWARDALTKADLEALAAATAWTELLAGAQSIRPSERDERWRQLVTQAASASLGDPGITDAASLAESEHLLRSFPHLSDAPEVMTIRTRRGLAVFAVCLTESWRSADCQPRLSAFVDAAPKDASLAAEAAKLMARHGYRAPSVAYFHRAIARARGLGEPGRKLYEAVCASDELTAGATEALKLAPTAPEVELSRQLAFEWCWSFLPRERFVTEVTAEERGLTNACAGLLAKSAINGVRATKCRRLVGGQP